jgi:hypothetical protein
MSDDPHETPPESYFPEIEAAYLKTIPEWMRLLRQTPGYGGGVTHAELVKMLITDYGMAREHADALVAHTLSEDGG